MKILVSEHLLSYETHRGYFVLKLEPSEMAQVYLIRLRLETEILRTIRWPSQSELADLRKLATETHTLLKEGLVHRSMEQARQLAFAIFDLSPLTFVAAEVKRYWEIADEYRALAMGAARASDPSASALQARHNELFAALETRDRRRLIKHNTDRRRQMVGR